MKERMQLEKAKKNGKKSKTSVEKKNQNPGEHTTEGQRKEKKTQKKKDDKENEQKAKEREEKKKKKEEYKQRQEFLLETRKSQAAARWASTNSEVHPIPAAGFTPLPLHSRNSTSEAGVFSPREQDETCNNVASPPTSQQILQRTDPSLPPAKRKKSTSLLNSPHSTSVSHSPTYSSKSKESPQSLQHGNTHPNQDETPSRLCNKEKSNCDPRRGLHFQGSLVESSSEDEDTSDHCRQDNPEVARGNCCREQRLENEALRKRIQKLQRRLDIACKSFMIIFKLI